MKKIIKVSSFLLSALLISTTTAFASTSYSYYNTTVGKFNGNGYTGYQTKTYSGAHGELKSSTVGGNYKVDARMRDNSGQAGSWTRDVTDNSTYTLKANSDHNSGESIQVQFSNDLTTPVAVQVSGNWKSN